MKRIAPAGVEINGEETWKATQDARLVRTDRGTDVTPGARVAVGDQLFPERRVQIVRTIWATARRRVFIVSCNITIDVILSP